MSAICVWNMLSLISFIVLWQSINCQSQITVRQEARWCVLNDEEMLKCQNLKRAIDIRALRDDVYPFNSPSYEELPQLECLQGMGHFDCMERISRHEADLIQLDAGLGYTAGEYFTMVPIMAENYDEASGDEGLEFYAVAIVRRDNPNIDFNSLADKKACHPSVGHAAGWVHPISTLIDDGIMPIDECNVPVKSAASFFGDMCAPNGLERFYNPFGNNPVTICKNCQGSPGEFCTSMDPFAGYGGAFECMASRVGDVAFVRDFTPDVMLVNSSYNRQDFQLLCRDGSRQSLDNAASCNLGVVSSHIVMASAAAGVNKRELYKQFLKQIDADFGYNGAHNDIFHLYSSEGYGGRKNVMFSDRTRALIDVETVTDAKGNPRDTYYTWVGAEFRQRLRQLNTCPTSQARWCVISQHEMTKCENMIMAFAAKGLKPDLNCIRGRDVRHCMDMIQQGDVDLIALDSADVFVAGKYYNLVPIAAEDYSGYEAHTYYSVAVARRTDAYLTIFNLKGRRSCHSSVMSASGWISPVDKLIETGQIHIDGCNVYRHVGQFFSKSCVPGVLNKAYNSKGSNPINLCEACAAGGPERCQRNDNELYYGNSGAFRCLTEFGGDIAFMKHTAVRENTDGRNEAEWARNRRSDDYQLLCNDGKRRDIDDWQECNMGEVPANAIVTADFKTKKERDIYWTLLNYAQQFFSDDDNEDFQMFQSMLNHKDLLFQDSTVRLVPVPEDLQVYDKYLGPVFTRSMERMEGIDCVTDAAAAIYTRYTSLLLCLVVVLLVRV